LDVSAKFARTVSPCIFSRMACAVRHWPYVGLAKLGKGEVLACLDQALYFTSSVLVLFTSESGFDLGLGLGVDSVELPSSVLVCEFALHGLRIAVLGSFVMLFFVVLATAKRMDLVIMIAVRCC
jgi:hypothetical protein